MYFLIQALIGLLAIAIIYLSPFRREYSLVEYFAQFTLPILIGVGVFAIITKSATMDDEIWADVAVAAIHQEYYETEETRSYRCRCDSDGQNCSTCYEDYCARQPETWYMLTRSGWSVKITEARFGDLRSKWGAQIKHIGEQGDFSCKKGKTFQIEWDGGYDRIESVFKAMRYENKVRFDPALVPDQWDEATMGHYVIHEKPIVSPSNGTSLVLGTWYSNLQKESADEVLRRHAAIYGSFPQEESGQVIPIFYLYQNQPRDIARAHRAKHMGGGKNEFSVLIGFSGTTIDWVDVVSFTESGACVNRSKEFILKHPEMALDGIATNIAMILSKHWQRRSFTQLNSIVQFKPSFAAMLTGWILNVVVSLIIFGISITNNERASTF